MTRLVLIVAFVLGILAAYFVFRARTASEVPEPVLGVMRSDPGSYEVGYEMGKRAFMIQMGMEVDPVVRYTTISGSSGGGNEEEMNRGYVDGYHRAADGFICPR